MSEKVGLRDLSPPFRGIDPLDETYKLTYSVRRRFAQFILPQETKNVTILMRSKGQRSPSTCIKVE